MNFAHNFLSFGKLALLKPQVRGEGLVNSDPGVSELHTVTGETKPMSLNAICKTTQYGQLCF